LKSISTQSFFDSSDRGVEHILHQTALQYAVDIIVNEIQIKSIKSAANFPIFLLFLGLMAIIFFLDRFPHH